jgi:hypothetical protein
VYEPDCELKVVTAAITFTNLYVSPEGPESRSVTLLITVTLRENCRFLALLLFVQEPKDKILQCPWEGRGMIHQRRSAVNQATSSALNCRILEPVLVKLAGAGILQLSGLPISP